MKTTLIRSALLLFLPFILGWAFFAELFREVRSGFWYACQEVRIEYDSFVKLWRDARDV